MPTTNYLQNILCFFCIMDIDLLRYHLKDKYTYQEATKEVFLDKIEAIFEKHRAAGDTELLLYPGACAGETCSNCGNRGYRFVGNHSNNYLDLLFETKGDDITDLYSCSQFRSDIEIADLNDRSSIDIDLDETANFPKPTSYWTRVYAAQDAYNEMITQPPRILRFDEIVYWLDKHSDLYEQLGQFRLTRPTMKWTPFLILYADLAELGTIISENIEAIRQANQSLVNSFIEKEPIEWVLAYEELYNKGNVELMYYLEKRGEDYGLIEFDNYLFTGEVFAHVFNFFDTYTTHFNELISKYSIYNEEEGWDADKNDRYSLRFHLQKRRELENIGVLLPYYQRKKS